MKLALPLLFALITATGARAEEYNTVSIGQSSIAFTFKQMGVPMAGRFGKFAAQLRFDPARPAAASAAIDIDLASIDAGSTEANDEVAGKQWFDIKTFPAARFVAGAIRPLGDNRYEAAGKLTIKGRAQDVLVPFTFTTQGKTGIAEGSLVIKRADYAIGVGPWADFGTVANDVQIKFHLQADAGPGKK
jgi:polyisoprenoid-binding protein YceI